MLRVSHFEAPQNPVIVVNGTQVNAVDARVAEAAEFNALKQRVQSQVRRTSLDALVAQTVKRVAICGGIQNQDYMFLAHAFEVKEALGM